VHGLAAATRGVLFGADRRQDVRGVGGVPRRDEPDVGGPPDEPERDVAVGERGDDRLPLRRPSKSM